MYANAIPQTPENTQNTNISVSNIFDLGKRTFWKKEMCIKLSKKKTLEEKYSNNRLKIVSIFKLHSI
jgi:hypothetical protein